MSVLGWLRHNCWSFAAIGILILWAVLSITTDRFSPQNLSGVASLASFLAIVGLGQMFAVATGGSNIDLSVASVITLSAFATMILSGGTNAGLAEALPVLVLIGFVTGAINAFLILRVRFAAISLLVAILLAFLGSIVLRRTGYGRTLMAVGQNAVAADLAGAHLGRITTVAFMISSILAALDGTLLSAHAGGAAGILRTAPAAAIAGSSDAMRPRPCSAALRGAWLGAQ